MQARIKRDLYDTLKMIKETSRNVDGFRGISRAKTVGWNLIKTLQVPRGKTQRANKFTKSSWVLRGMLWDFEGKSRELTKYTELTGFSREQDGKKYSVKNRATRVFLLLYKA